MSKTKGARRKRFPRGQIYRPSDLADERVLTLDELVRQDPLPATEPMPAEVKRMLEPDSSVRYIESEKEPDVRVTHTEVGRGSSGRIWEVRLEGGRGGLLNGRPGLEQTILEPDTTVGREGPRLGASHRPPWMRTEFLPRLSPRRQYVSGMEILPEIASNRPMHTLDYTGEGWVVGWPWTCIGKVQGGFDTDFNTVVTSGTGVLIGRNILLTAAHLGIWGRGPGRWWMRFSPGFDVLLPNLAVSFVEQFRGPGPQSHPNPNDFIVCKLYVPLGDALGFLGFHWSSNDDFYYDQRWLSAGYPAFKYGGQRLISEYDIEVQDIDDDGDGREIEISLNNFLLNGGWSGGPLWGWFPGNDPRVIGVCSGWETDGWDPARTVFAGGKPMVSHAHDARKDWA